MLHFYKDTTLSVEEQVPASQPPGNYYENPEGPRYQNPAEYDQAAQQPPQQKWATSKTKSQKHLWARSLKICRCIIQPQVLVIY